MLRIPSDGLVEVLHDALTVLPGLGRLRQVVIGCLAATRPCLTAAAAALCLLCACTAEDVPTAAPTRAPLPAATRTDLPTLTPQSPIAPTPLPIPPPPADLAVRGPEFVHALPGETTVYTLALQNHGSTLATGIVLTDMLPPGLNPIWTEPALPLCQRRGQRVSCDAGDFQEGGAISVSLDVSVPGSDAPVSSARLAGLTWELDRPACAIEKGADTSSFWCHLASLKPGDEAQVRLGVTVDAGTAAPLVHTASIRSNEHDTGPGDNSATLTVTVGALTAAPTVTASTSAASATTDLVVEADGPATVIAGQPFTYSYTITNQGTLTATGVHFDDPLPPATTLHAYAPAPPRCEQQGDRLTCYLREPESGETLTFTLAVSGHGGQPVKVGLDPLMPGWPMCTILKEREHLHIVNCELGNLGPGEAAHVQLGLVARGVQERLITNTASVKVNEIDGNVSDNVHTATLAVATSADLSVRSAVPATAAPGELLTYTLTVANAGPSDASGVEVADVLPRGTRFVSGAASQGRGCRLDAGAQADTIRCDLARLSAGTTATVTMVVATDETLPTPSIGTIGLVSRVEAEQPDPDPDNNQAAESIPVSTGGID